MCATPTHHEKCMLWKPCHCRSSLSRCVMLIVLDIMPGHSGYVGLFSGGRHRPGRPRPGWARNTTEQLHQRQADRPAWRSGFREPPSVPGGPAPRLVMLYYEPGNPGDIRACDHHATPAPAPAAAESTAAPTTTPVRLPLPASQGTPLPGGARGHAATQAARVCCWLRAARSRRSRDFKGRRGRRASNRRPAPRAARAPRRSPATPCRPDHHDSGTCTRPLTRYVSRCDDHHAYNSLVKVGPCGPDWTR